MEEVLHLAGWIFYDKEDFHGELELGNFIHTHCLDIREML